VQVIATYGNLRTVMHHFMTDIAVRRTSNTRTISTAVLLCGLVGLFFIPDSFFSHSPTLCIHRQLFGFNCPGCGMTRALHALLHFKFTTAFHFNFAVFSLFPLLTTEIFLGLRFTDRLFSIRTIFYFLLCITLTINYALQLINFINL